MKKKSVLAIVLVIGIFVSIGKYLSFSLMDGQSETDESKELLAVYIQDDMGDYTLSQENRFPVGLEYALNVSKSYCTNGGVLSQDHDTGMLSLVTSFGDSCMVYFDRKTIYTLTIDPNGGTYAETSISVVHGSTVSLDEPTREGYAFNGWYINGEPLSSEFIVTSDLTVKAMWHSISVGPTGPSSPVTP